MKKQIRILSISVLFITLTAFIVKAQEAENEYEFTDEYRLETSSVKSQDRTGTCWCFTTVSFLEAELLRMGKEEYDLSEMFLVHNTYQKKADHYVRFHGKNNFGQGGQAHDAIYEFKQHGIVPEEVYPGIKYGGDTHQHSELVSVLKGFLEPLVENRRSNPSPVWEDAYQSVLDSYLGKTPEEFEYQGKTFTPKSFAEFLEINPDDYVEITSYNHQPFYESFVLEVPDNWSHDLYYNLPLDEFMDVMYYSIENGYSVVWDGDVSSEGFSHGDGIAVVPEDEEADFKNKPVKEKDIDQEYRQKLFNNFTTTDDHLMHLTGIGKDKNGKSYFVTKNSWGEDSNEYDGFLYMSEPYAELNTIAIMVHKDAIPDEIANKLDIE
ncbi:MAG: C1 family peptidase [Bacteroidales bacterium]